MPDSDPQQLTIWGRANSVNVQKVLWCAEELGLSYQRIDAGSTALLMDTGRPPPLALSQEAHAGCLAFELSSGPSRIVILRFFFINHSCPSRSRSTGLADHQASRA